MNFARLTFNLNNCLNVCEVHTNGINMDMKVKIEAANHNPIIGVLPDDTYNDVTAVLSLLHDMTWSRDTEELCLNKQQTRGLSCILLCLVDAMEYEKNHRPKCKKA